MTDSITVYLDEVGQYPLLTAADENRLARLIEAGVAAKADLGGDDAPASGSSQDRALRRAVRRGDKARERFVQSNLRLVVSIAKRYQSSGIPLLDLIQDGNMGLMHAVTKFDYRRGFKFSTYATWWIRQHISRGVAAMARTIRLPAHATDTLARLNGIEEALRLETGKTPSVEEIADRADLPLEKATEILAYQDSLSLDVPRSDDEAGGEFGDTVHDSTASGPDEVAMATMLPDEIAKLLAPLEDRERKVLELHFGLGGGEPLTMVEIGDVFSINRDRVRQIEAQALAKLRHPSVDTGARDLLDL